MLSRLYNLSATIAFATMLAVGGFAAFLVFAGKLNSARLETIAAVLRGELDDWEDSDTPVTQPETAEAPAPAAKTADEIHAAKIHEQVRRAVLERAAADVSARQALLDQAMQELIHTQETFETSRKEWEETQKKLTAEVRDEGFKREIEYISKLDPKLAKEHLLRVWDKHENDAVRIMSALNPRIGQRILSQMKSSNELQIMSELLERIRLHGTDAAADRSGTNKRADRQ
jgi:flagellar motility protein MotE (MotC chaperone)